MSGSAGGPFSWVGDTDRIRRERKNMNLSPRKQTNPYLFLKADRKLAALAPYQQKQAVKRLAAIAGAEGSELGLTDWKSEIDPATNLEANEAHLLQIGGKLPLEERREQQLQRAESARAQERDRARDDIMDWCRDLDDAQIDGADLMAVLVADEYDDPVVDRARDAGVDVDALDQLLEDIENEYDAGLVADAIEECRDRLGGPSLPETPAEQELLEKLRRNFDLEGMAAPTIDHAIRQIQSRIDRAEREAERDVEAARERAAGAEQRGRQAVLNRLRRAFGGDFEDVDAAVDYLEELLQQRRAPELKSAEITARMAGGTPSISLETFDSTILQYEDNVKRLAGRSLDLSALTTSRITLGTVRTEGGELAEINLEPGRERLGPPPADTEAEAVENFVDEPPEPVARFDVATEQVELPEPETPAEEIATDMIDALERPGGGGGGAGGGGEGGAEG